jgi:hypothetical protein
MSDHANEQAGPADPAAPTPESNGQEHQNPETEEDTASGGAPDE